MKQSRVWVSVVMIGAVLGFKATLVRADDPLQVAPTMYKLLFENNRTRVMEVTFKAGEKIAKHSHPDHMVYVVEGGKLKISKPDGTSGDNDLKQGQVVWIPAETHWAENTGATTVRLLVTELKEPSKKAKP
jgi:quercetin dioxygenase-like cupin family protein